MYAVSCGKRINPSGHNIFTLWTKSSKIAMDKYQKKGQPGLPLLAIYGEGEKMEYTIRNVRPEDYE